VGQDTVKLELVKGDHREALGGGRPVIVAIGVVANLEGAVSPKVKLDLDRGFVNVDGNYQTNVKGIYAAGRHHRPTLAGGMQRCSARSTP